MKRRVAIFGAIVITVIGVFAILIGSLCASSMERATWWRAIGTIVLGIFAVFHERIRDWLWGPDLSISVSGHLPDFVRSRGPDTYWLRLSVCNRGKLPARDVEVIAEQLSKLAADGQFHEVDAFLRRNLTWAYGYGTDHGRLYSSMSSGSRQHCDMARICRAPRQDQSPSLHFALAPQHISGATEEVGPGTYRLVIVVHASNAKPTKKTLEIKLTGEWRDSLAEMWRDGIQVSVVT